MNFILFNNHKFLYFLLFIFKYTKFLCQINDNFQSGILEEGENDLIDIADYLNTTLIISTSKNIYIGAPLSNKTSTNANLNSSSFAATCNENYILVACLEDELLVKININTGIQTTLLSYSNYNSIIVSNHSCSLSILENFVFIAISRPISDNTVNYFFIKLNITNKDDIENGPIINERVEIKSFIFPYDVQKSNKSRDLSCETVFSRDNDEYKFLCVHENVTNSKNRLYGFILNTDFDGIYHENEIKSSIQEFGFRLYYLDKYYIRLVTRQFIYNLYFKDNTIKKYNGNTNLTSYESFYYLYFYNNNFVFSIRKEKNFTFENGNSDEVIYFKINTNLSEHYLIYSFEDDISDIKKIIGFYNDTNDYLILIYQCKEISKYFAFPNNKEIFHINSFQDIYRVKSNEELDYNFSNIIQYEKYFGELNFQNFKKISSTEDFITINNPVNHTTLASLPININSKKINLDPSLNFWYEINFAFIEQNEKYIRVFSLPNANISIRTCAFQCGKCLNDYFECENCRDLSFSKLEDSNDSNCYPINQTIIGYIYNSSKKIFKKCYPSCKFCSLEGEESSLSYHNCIICAEGYSPSYIYKGNCYKTTENKEDKTITSITDESFKLIQCSSLSNMTYKISSTGECISECPTNSSYNYISKYIFNNYTEQEYGKYFENLTYEIDKELPLKYSFGYLCYDECPSYTEIDEINYKCNCKYAWHKTSTGEIICYDEDYCIYNEFKYYLDDSKECINDGCPSNYYQFNFQCYKNSCPNGTNIIDLNKCKSNFNYCYINKYYQNICNDTENQEYSLNFNNTNQYLKTCQESINYTIYEKKTYLYNEICYIVCPDDTIVDEDNEICKCKYFGYYSKNSDSYICYSKEEKCKDKIPVIDIKKCVDSIDECITEKYKVFNNECYTEICPENTKLNINNGYTCICSYYFYKENNILICFNSSVTSCEKKNYSYSNPNTLECFNSLEDCFTKENEYFFNNYCYKEGCPQGTILIENTKNCTNETNNINEEITESYKTTDGIKETNKITYEVTEINKYIDEISETNKNIDEFLKTNKITEKNSEIENNENDDFEIVYPKEYYDNPDICLAVYNNTCYSRCPTNTCITQRDINLVYCINTQSDMTVFNDICFTNIDEIYNNLKYISENNILYTTSSGIIVGAYNKNSQIDDFNISYTLIYLNRCEDLLKKFYNLSSETDLYILGVETPNKNKNSSVNVYNYRIYLENGTQLENLEICDGEKITISSKITNEELIKLEEAKYFASYGYNIYDINDDFYTNTCSPASINGSDITLTDRKIDFYPSNVYMCNESCKLNYVDLKSERIECDCDIGYNFSEINSGKIEEDIVEISFLDYLLSFMNYKIVKCYELLIKPENYYKNSCFYIGAIITVICIVEMVIFFTYGIKSINSFIKENEPNYSKLEQMRIELEEKRKDLLISYLIRNKRKKSKKNYVNNLKTPNQPLKKKSNSNLENQEKINNSNKLNKKKNSILKSEKNPKNLNFGNKNKRKKSEINSTLISSSSKRGSISSFKSFNKSLLKNKKKSLFINEKNLNKKFGIKKIKLQNKRRNSQIQYMSNYEYLLKINEKEIDKKELNDLPYKQALRIDKRSIFETFLYVITNKIEIISIFFYSSPYLHLTISTSIYFFHFY